MRSPPFHLVPSFDQLLVFSFPPTSYKIYHSQEPSHAACSLTHHPLPPSPITPSLHHPSPLPSINPPSPPPKVLEAKKVLMKHVTSALQGEEFGMKVAALKCVLFWSRSPQLLRTTLIDYEVWRPLQEVCGGDNWT